MEKFDLIAIGGGTAGLVTAAGGASLGLKVALIEREALGGDCLWTGCVPSKALIASAKLAHQMRHADRLGLVGASPKHVFREVMERMRAARARVAVHDDPDRFRKLGVDVVFGNAEFEAANVVRVDDRRLESNRIVVATGSYPTIPPIPGLTKTDGLTHLTAFDQDTLPNRIGILGGGPIGLEFAQVYSRLGATVTVFEMLPRILPREDPEASDAIESRLAEEGITVRTEARVEQISKTDDGGYVLSTTGEADASIDVSVDEIFIATGRRGSTEGLGLGAIGVELDNGSVKVGRNLRSTVPGIWAAGDVAGGLQFTHVADYQAKLVLRNAVFPFTSKGDYTAVPWVTYTDPEVARVGATEVQAREKHGDVQVYRYDLDDLDRAIVDAHATGFVKVVTRTNGKILGATIVASGAGEMIMPLVLAMKRGIPFPKLSQAVYPYPTMVEGVKRTSDLYYRAKLQGTSGKLIRKVVGWLA